MKKKKKTQLFWDIVLSKLLISISHKKLIENIKIDTKFNKYLKNKRSNQRRGEVASDVGVDDTNVTIFLDRGEMIFKSLF